MEPEVEFSFHASMTTIDAPAFSLTPQNRDRAMGSPMSTSGQTPQTSEPASLARFQRWHSMTNAKILSSPGLTSPALTPSKFLESADGPSGSANLKAERYDQWLQATDRAVSLSPQLRGSPALNVFLHHSSHPQEAAATDRAAHQVDASAGLHPWPLRHLHNSQSATDDDGACSGSESDPNDPASPRLTSDPSSRPASSASPRPTDSSMHRADTASPSPLPRQQSKRTAGLGLFASHLTPGRTAATIEPMAISPCPCALEVVATPLPVSGATASSRPGRLQTGLVGGVFGQHSRMPRTPVDEVLELMIAGSDSCGEGEPKQLFGEEAERHVVPSSDGVPEAAASFSVTDVEGVVARSSGLAGSFPQDAGSAAHQRGRVHQVGDDDASSAGGEEGDSSSEDECDVAVLLQALTPAGKGGAARHGHAETGGGTPIADIIELMMTTPIC